MDFEEFVLLHEPQLKLSSVPEHLWPKLHEKLEKEFCHVRVNGDSQWTVGSEAVRYELAKYENGDYFTLVRLENMVTEGESQAEQPQWQVLTTGQLQASDPNGILRSRTMRNSNSSSRSSSSSIRAGKSGTITFGGKVPVAPPESSTGLMIGGFRFPGKNPTPSKAGSNPQLPKNFAPPPPNAKMIFPQAAPTASPAKPGYTTYEMLGPPMAAPSGGGLAESSKSTVDTALGVIPPARLGNPGYTAYGSVPEGSSSNLAKPGFTAYESLPGKMLFQYHSPNLSGYKNDPTALGSGPGPATPAKPPTTTPSGGGLLGSPKFSGVGGVMGKPGFTSYGSIPPSNVDHSGNTYGGFPPAIPGCGAVLGGPPSNLGKPGFTAYGSVPDTRPASSVLLRPPATAATTPLNALPIVCPRIPNPGVVFDVPSLRSQSPGNVGHLQGSVTIALPPSKGNLARPTGFDFSKIPPRLPRPVPVHGPSVLSTKPNVVATTTVATTTTPSAANRPTSTAGTGISNEGQRLRRTSSDHSFSAKIGVEPKKKKKSKGAATGASKTFKYGSVIEPLLNENPGFLLTLEPSDEVHFVSKSGQLSGDVLKANLKIINNSSKRLAWKLKCSDNRLFAIQTAVGTLEKSGSTTVALRTKPAPDGGKTPFSPSTLSDAHCFTVYQAVAPAKKTARDIWTTPTGNEPLKQISVKFVQQPTVADPEEVQASTAPISGIHEL